MVVRMKLKLVIVLVFIISLLYGQDRRKVGLIPTINESGKKYDWVSYGLEYLLYNKLSVLTKSIDFLLDTQSNDGFWKRIAFYAGPRYPLPHSVWFGGEALTTALCVEALARFKTLIA